MKNLYLPAITGQYGNWRYYQIIMSVQNITEYVGFEEDKPVHRIRTVDEVNEIYSGNINEMLQRIFDENRLDPIRNYLTKQSDGYINNLTVATFGGEPEWYPIGLNSSSLLENDDYSEDQLEEFGKAFGIIKLTGKEILFVLDGQHRVMGLREAVKVKESLKNQEIAITLIAHESTSTGKKRTRRLFTTINRYAKPVSLGESILLDEDDLSSIIVRKLIEDYPRFKKYQLIALNKEANLSLPRDSQKFSTVIALWNINEKLIDHKRIYPSYNGPKKNMVRVRPNDEIVEREKKMIFDYWNLFFNHFPLAKKFVNDPNSVSRDNGGPWSLRPIGQQIFVEFYLKVRSLGQNVNLIERIPENLNDAFWHYILWNPQANTMTGTKAFARDYIYYHLGIPLTASQLTGLKSNYKKFRKDDTAALPASMYI